MSGVPKDLAGNRFGRLIALEKTNKRLCGQVIWLCLCDCGNRKEVASGNLKSGVSKSCGCLRKEVIRDRSIKHGLGDTRIYKSWHSMIRRCENLQDKGYSNYGGRGIKVCKSWLSFENFYKDMIGGYNDTLTIDRMDNNKGYSKENCHWATYKEQANNTRKNRLITYKNKTQNMTQWANELGIRCATLWARLNVYTWTIEEALTIKKYD